MFQVILARLFSYARGGAVVDVVFQACLVFSAFYAFALHGHVAGAGVADVFYYVEQGVHRRHVAVRAEILRTVAYAAPCFQNPRIVLVCNANGGVCLVVFKKYVVVGLIALDKVVFQKQRVFLGVDDDIFNVANLANEYARLYVLLLADEVRTDSAL